MNILQIIANFKKQSEPNATLLAEYAQLQDRNKARIEEIKKQMGEKYIMHKSHMKTRLSEPRPV